MYVHSESETLYRQTHTHLPVDVPAVSSGETLYMKCEATLVDQALQKSLRAFIVSVVLLFFPITACKHHHIALQSKSKLWGVFFFHSLYVHTTANAILNHNQLTHGHASCRFNLPQSTDSSTIMSWQQGIIPVAGSRRWLGSSGWSPARLQRPPPDSTAHWGRPPAAPGVPTPPPHLPHLSPHQNCSRRTGQTRTDSSGQQRDPWGQRQEGERDNEREKRQGVRLVNVCCHYRVPVTGLPVWKYVENVI